MIVMPSSFVFEAKFSEARVNKRESGKLKRRLMGLRPVLGGLPLDRAAHGWNLLARALSGVGNLAHRFEQLAARVGGASLFPACVKAPAILQLEPVVEAEEVRRAHRVIRACHVLALVIEIREREAVRLREVLHVVEGVLRVVNSIVRGDGDGVDAVSLELRCVAHDAIDHRLHVRAVIADEHHQRAVLAPQISEAVGLAVHAGKRKGWRLPAKTADRGLFRQARYPRQTLCLARSLLLDLRQTNLSLRIWRNRTSSATGLWLPNSLLVSALEKAAYACELDLVPFNKRFVLSWPGEFDCANPQHHATSSPSSKVS